MNELIRFLNSHVSVRQFTDQHITDDDARTIVATAQRSATSSNLQAYSIIMVRDPQTKARIAELAGKQKHIEQASLFLVFCADLYRLRRVSQRAGYPFLGQTVEMLIVATVDTALVADRALTAAQALGMGGVMVGAIRNNPDQIAELLKLPELTYPVMGMSLGYPAARTEPKPRLPLEIVCHEEQYHPEKIDAGVEEYDRIVDDFGHLRGREVLKDKYPNFSGLYSWAEHTARRLADTSPTTQRLHMKEFLEKRGFLLR